MNNVNVLETISTEVIVSATEGDNAYEIRALTCKSENSTYNAFELVVFAHDQDEPLLIHQGRSTSLDDAFDALAQFLKDEYAESIYSPITS